MGWSMGYSHKHKRDVGYGVPAICEHPECTNEIDRGLAYVCGDMHDGGEYGCGLYFCGEHLLMPMGKRDDCGQLCERCLPGDEGGDPFDPKPDTQQWIDWKETDPSWQKWRDERDNQLNINE